MKALTKVASLGKAKSFLMGKRPNTMGGPGKVSGMIRSALDKQNSSKYLRRGGVGLAAPSDNFLKKYLR